MASSIKKNSSLIATIAVILIAGLGGYYLLKLKQGPYPASSFVSITYKWGTGDSLINSYNSETGVYQYLDNRDSLIMKKVKLNANNVIFLHSRANEAGLWELPELTPKSYRTINSKVLHYEILFTYEKKTKKILFYPDLVEDSAVANQVAKLITAIEQTIKDAEERSALD